MFLRILFLSLSLILLIYMIMPGPSSINDFPPLPNSDKSTLSGDTWQIPNVSAYFSDFYRDYTTNFYYQAFKNKTLLPFSPIRLNYPPEHAFVAIKVQTESTFLEEYIYPMRNSIFVNGFEPFDQEGKPRFRGATHFKTDNGKYLTKVTLRYYPTNTLIRILIWLGSVLSVYLIYVMYKKILR